MSGGVLRASWKRISCVPGFIQEWGIEGEFKISSFWFWCWSREWGCGVSLRFSCVISGMDRFSLDLPRAVKSRECTLGVRCGGVLRSWVHGICNCRLIKSEILWIYNLDLEQTMRNLTCGDQQILIMVKDIIFLRLAFFKKTKSVCT